MAIIQTETSLRSATVPNAFYAGTLVVYESSFVLPAGKNIAAADIVEISKLAAFHKIHSARLFVDGNFGAATANVGIMTGEVGSDDTSRTVDSVIFSAADLSGNVESDVDMPALTLAPSSSDRSIGVKFSAQVTGAGQKLTLQLAVYQ